MSPRFVVLDAPVLAALALLLCDLLAPAARAQTLQADYQVQNTYASSVGSIGPLTVVGGTDASFVQTTVDSQSQLVLELGTGGDFNAPPVPPTGVQTQTNPFLSASNYSVVLLADFSLDVNLVATKVFDFKNLSSDSGLYINDTTGLLSFYDGTNTTVGTNPFTSGNYGQIVLTRNGTTNVTDIYVNGTLDITFTDTSGAAILGDATASGNSFLTLFKDDGTGVGSTVVPESTTGDIARLRLYVGVLDAATVANLDRTVPEPATWTWGGIGVLVLVFGFRRRAAAVA